MLLVDVKAPEDLYQVLRDNEPIALPKKDEDIRPVGMGLVIRKLVSILFLFHTFEKPAVIEDSTRKLGESTPLQRFPVRVLAVWNRKDYTLHMAVSGAPSRSRPLLHGRRERERIQASVAMESSGPDQGALPLHHSLPE